MPPRGARIVAARDRADAARLPWWRSPAASPGRGCEGAARDDPRAVEWWRARADAAGRGHRTRCAAPRTSRTPRADLAARRSGLAGLERRSRCSSWPRSPAAAGRRQSPRPPGTRPPARGRGAARVRRASGPRGGAAGGRCRARAAATPPGSTCRGDRGLRAHGACARRARPGPPLARGAARVPGARPGRAGHAGSVADDADRAVRGGALQPSPDPRRRRAGARLSTERREPRGQRSATSPGAGPRSIRSPSRSRPPPGLPKPITSASRQPAAIPRTTVSTVRGTTRLIPM